MTGLLTVVAGMAALAAELPVQETVAPYYDGETTELDYLDEANYEPRASGTGFASGAVIDLHNGNLRIVHQSSPAFPGLAGLRWPGQDRHGEAGS
jgi:hypothetical protein